MVEFNLHFYRIWENIYFSKCVHCGQSEHTHNNKKKRKKRKKIHLVSFHFVIVPEVLGTPGVPLMMMMDC